MSRAHVLDVIPKELAAAGFHVNQVGDSFLAFRLQGAFELTLMPGNSRVLISQKSIVYPEFRGLGLGKQYLELREEVARKASCNLLLATVRNDNAVEIHLLESHGWKRYNNRDTGVSLWGKEL